MSNVSRLFEIIQILRSAKKPVLAEELADRLEVSPRTIYRDTARLQSMRIPIEGEAGIGYIMRPGYDLPPLNFDEEEIEAIIVGLGLLARTGDKGLQKAADRIRSKVETLQNSDNSLQVNTWGASPVEQVDMDQIRKSIREETKLQITYQNSNEQMSERTIQPIAIIYYTESLVLAAWCELRKAFRHFRTDRIQSCTIMEENFEDQSDALRKRWEQELSPPTDP